MVEENKGTVKKRGGARPGAGRSKLEIPKKRKDVSFYLTQEHLDILEEEAALSGDQKLGTFLNKLAENHAESLIRKKKKQSDAEKLRS